MAIPDYQTIMLPLLNFASDNQEHRFRDAVEALADSFNLTDDERKELLPSGQQQLFNNRVGWSRMYLVKASLLEATRRGYFQITGTGQKALSQNPKKIDKNFLMQFPEFVEALEAYKTKPKPKPDKSEQLPDSNLTDATPEETLEAAFQELQDGLALELLNTIKKCHPEFFERLVIDVLIKMGYGGSRREAGQAVGQSGDGGIDGIICF